MAKNKKEMPTKFSFWARFKKNKNRTTLIIDEELVKRKKSDKFDECCSRRYSTDCFSDFFTEKVLNSDVGIADLEEYGTEKATFEELSKQNSYFVNDLLNGLKDKK